MPRVYNKRSGGYVDAIYVGRPSKWGNPFSHLSNTTAQFKVDTREQAVSKYEEWLLSQPALVEQAKKELRGHDLVCWCTPLACHANILLRIANE